YRRVTGLQNLGSARLVIPSVIMPDCVHRPVPTLDRAEERVESFILAFALTHQVFALQDVLLPRTLRIEHPGRNLAVDEATVRATADLFVDGYPVNRTREPPRQFRDNRKITGRMPQDCPG